MRRVASIVVLLATYLLPAPVVGQEHPRVLGQRESWGYEWVAASMALDADGSVSPNMPMLLHERLTSRSNRFENRFGSAHEHGLREGEIPPEEFCFGQEIIEWVVSEGYGRFDAAILLSEVAVTGTVEEVVLGFGPRANPIALLALSDVVPLHARSPVPRYVLLPLGRAVIANRVFCGSKGDGRYEPRLRARLVVMGSWGQYGVVSLRPSAAGSLATVEADGSLTWRWLHDTGPSNLTQVRDQIADFAAKSLFDAAAHLVGTTATCDERREFGGTLDGLARDGCELLAATESPDGGWSLNRDCAKAPKR